jgi:PPM family protein phosphatase
MLMICHVATAQQWRSSPCLPDKCQKRRTAVAYNFSFSAEKNVGSIALGPGHKRASIMKVRPGLEIAGLSDVGCQRNNNEDSSGYWESENNADFERLGRLLVIADGMGGAEGGQYASRIAVETTIEIYSSPADGENPQQRLVRAFSEANARVQKNALENPLLHGMGTTLTAFAIVGAHLYYAHVGDSRLYLLRQGNLQLLTHDDSLVARLVANGVVRAEDAEHHPQRHVLIAAIGVSETVEPDTSAEPLGLEAADVLLLCTDGLWGQMSDSEIASILSSQAPNAASRALIALAKERGGPDNITVQVAKVS